MGTPATPQQKSNQAAIMAKTGRATSHKQVRAFDRFVSVIKGQSCQATDHPNGHITQTAGTICAETRAMAFLAGLMASGKTEDQALKAMGDVQLLTIDRFMCLTPEGTQKCRFGHKTEASALACVGAGKAPKAAKTSITVKLAGRAPSTTPATPKATPKAKATTTPNQAKTGPARLTSGSQGQVGGQAHPTTPTTPEATPKATPEAKAS